MTKLPAAGRVKTRLVPALSPEQAADVHRIFLLHLLQRLNACGPAAIIVCYDPPDAAAAMALLLSGAGAMELISQSAGDLGQRMAAAAATTFRRHDRILFLGVDSPDVPGSHLARAVSLLAENDVVIGPSADGGFWCLGLRDGVDAPKLLANIPWSSGAECQTTLQRASAMSYRLATADSWDDIDHPADLARLRQRLDRSNDPAEQSLARQLDAILLNGGSRAQPRVTGVPA